MDMYIDPDTKAIRHLPYWALDAKPLFDRIEQWNDVLQEGPFGPAVTLTLEPPDPESFVQVRGTIDFWCNGHDKPARVPVEIRQTFGPYRELRILTMSGSHNFELSPAYRWQVEAVVDDNVRVAFVGRKKFDVPY